MSIEPSESIRFQFTGEKHRIDRFDTDKGWWITKCEQKCLFGLIGKLQLEPDKKDCEICYR